MSVLESLKLGAKRAAKQTAAVVAQLQGNWAMQAEIIEGQRAEVATAIDALEVRRAAASLDSLGGGDENLLTDLNKELFRLKQRASDLEAAGKEARRRQAADEATAKALSEAERKVKLSNAYDRYVANAARIDQAITDLAELGHEWHKSITDIHILAGSHALSLRASAAVGAVVPIAAHRCRHLGFKSPTSVTFTHDDPRSKLAHHLVGRSELGLEE